MISRQVSQSPLSLAPLRSQIQKFWDVTGNSNFSSLLISSSASAFAPLLSPIPLPLAPHPSDASYPPVQSVMLLDSLLHSWCGCHCRDTSVHTGCRGWQAGLGLTWDSQAQVSLVPSCPGWGMLWLNCFPHTFICWSPKLQYLRMWKLFGNSVVTDVICEVKVK